MTEDTHLVNLLRSAMPPVGEAASPSRDLWPLVATRHQAGTTWSWLDVGLAVGVAITLLARPDWFVLVAYHL